MRKNKQLAMYFKKQSGHKTIRQYVNKEILNSCNLGAPGQLTVQNNISNDKLFNISTVLPLGFVIPTCWFSCPPLAGRPKSSISRRGYSKAGGGAQCRRVLLNSSRFTRRKAAFTLAEVLITIGIIGVVAAMTLPTLVNKYQQKQSIAQLQKVYSVLNQAFRRSEADNESSIYWDTSKGSQVFFNTYWKPYLNIIEECKGTKIAACAYTSSTPWKRANNRQDGYFLVLSNTRTPVILADGSFVSILTSSGYGSGTGDTDEDGNVIYDETKNGADTRIIVDLNASKLPNTFGKDVFLLERVAGKGIMPYGYNKDDEEIDANCSKSGSGYMCAAKLIRDGWEMKNNYPW